MQGVVSGRSCKELSGQDLAPESRREGGGDMQHSQ